MGLDEVKDSSSNKNATMNNFLNLQRALQPLDNEQFEEFQKNITKETVFDFHSFLLN